jgi:regulatory protein
MAVTQDRQRTVKNVRPPLDMEGLKSLALGYAGRYATTRAKLRAYLTRKLGERGWAGEGRPDVDALVERMATLRYVDDRAFADARGAGLTRRGYGARRVAQALRAAGIEDDDAADARQAADGQAWDAALAFARRRRIGPFAAVLGDRDKAIAALLRAGHGFEIARLLATAAPGEIPDAPN